MAGEHVKQIGTVSIRARAGDRFVSATELAKAAGKKWNDYARLDGTQEFIQALAQSTGIPADQLVQTKSGNSGGTWIHPRVAMHFGQWVSAEFAVAVSGWVLELLTTGKVELKPAGGDEFRALIDQVQQLQQQVTALAARPAELVAPAMPRFTVRQRLAWHGWHECPKKARKNIQKMAAALIDQFCSEPVHQAGGAGGGGPALYSGNQLVHLDEAIHNIRNKLRREAEVAAKRQPTIPFDAKVA